LPTNIPPKDTCEVNMGAGVKTHKAWGYGARGNSRAPTLMRRQQLKLLNVYKLNVIMGTGREQILVSIGKDRLCGLVFLATDTEVRVRFPPLIF
jgi:hypothetical protein